ncbi:hypothetical protein GCM10022420_088070 [Streptomyces iranensis]|uniref:histidine kinase n=1 Tax=Streptomyces iranensis TaxID=576784 RepID=A0A060ZYN7_9ACTN|nr:signal transduction histidine kinase [Streptomyces iranensis]CDR13058.1 two-component system sensor kinase [Streptomyces iranensis]
MEATTVGIPLWLSAGVMLRQHTGETGSWFFIGDPLVALGCLTALLWRRRFPLAIAMTVTIASTASALATDAAFLALVSLSTRRRPVESGVVGLALVTASQFTDGFYPVRSTPGLMWCQLAFPALTAGIAVAIGMAIGARRIEVRTLRDRAESAEREQTARAAQARALERNRIAREMHDVLAHQISLVAMQAGVDVTLTTTVTGTPSDTARPGRLTNAAKHAPGAHVHITLQGTTGDNVTARLPWPGRRGDVVWRSLTSPPIIWRRLTVAAGGGDDAQVVVGCL